LFQSVHFGESDLGQFFFENNIELALMMKHTEHLNIEASNRKWEISPADYN